MRVLLPIHPGYTAKIFSGEKQYEYRKKLFAKEVDTIIIYETAPTSMVVGETKITGIISGTPNFVWAETYPYTGIDEKPYQEYFRNRDFAVAYSLGKYIKYDSPKPLSDYGIKYAPQSYVYLD